MKILKFLIGSSLDIENSASSDNLQKLLNHITLSILMLSDNMFNIEFKGKLHNFAIGKYLPLLNRLLNKLLGHLIGLE